MKKTYIIPEVYCMNVAAEKMISASGDLMAQPDGTLTGTLGSSDATSDALSKRNYSVWDEDWSAAE